MTRDDFVRAMTPSLIALRTRLGRTARQLDMAWIAARIFDQVALCGYEIVRRDRHAEPHSTPPFVPARRDP